MTSKPRYFVEASRNPSKPMSAVSLYRVCERAVDNDGRPCTTGIETFSVRMLGDAEAQRRANAMRDALMAKAS